MISVNIGKEDRDDDAAGGIARLDKLTASVLPFCQRACGCSARWAILEPRMRICEARDSLGKDE